MIAAARIWPLWALCTTLLATAPSCLAGEASAGEVSTPEAVALAPEQLEASIDDVLRRPEFAWRPGFTLERPATPSELSPLVGFFESTRDLMRRGWSACARWFERFRRWLHRSDPAEPPQGGIWLGAMPPWLVLALAGLGLVAVVGATWLWKRRSVADSLDVAVEVAESVVELPDDPAEAASVEPDRWRAWATELVAEGRLREAVRALYLGMLSALAARDLLRLARTKTNRDYRLELARRAPDRADLQTGCAMVIEVYEQSWFGRREPSEETVRAVASCVAEVGHA